MTPFEELHQFLKEIGKAQVCENHLSNLVGMFDPKTEELSQLARENHAKTLLLADILEKAQQIAEKQAQKVDKGDNFPPLARINWTGYFLLICAILFMYRFLIGCFRGYSGIVDKPPRNRVWSWW